jgi:hypothetical protein
MDKLADKVREFSDIATGLPDNLQVVCFELLLEHYLDTLAPRPAAQKLNQHLPPADQPKGDAEGATIEDTAKGQSDLVLTELHTKVRHFLKKNSLSIDLLRNLFYKEGDEILPLYDDLKTTRMAAGQIRIALLQALQSAFASGDFEADTEVVRRECIDRKCYDQSNFSANFKSSKDLFDDVYDKTTKVLRLSEAGRKQLAEVIKDLQ